MAKIWDGTNISTFLSFSLFLFDWNNSLSLGYCLVENSREVERESLLFQTTIRHLSLSESPESNCSLQIQCRWVTVVIIHGYEESVNQFTFLSLCLMLLLLESKKWFGRWYFWNCRTNQGIYLNTVLSYHMWWFYALFELLKCLVTWVEEFHIFHPLQYHQNNVFPSYWPCVIDQKCLYIWYERCESRSEGCMWEDGEDMIESVPDDHSLTFLRQYHWLFWRYECWPRKIEETYKIYLISI